MLTWGKYLFLWYEEFRIFKMTDRFSQDPAIIKRLKEILEAHLENERFGVSELAKAAGLSRSNLHRKVHAYNGNSTSQFIREFRLQKAMEMLLEGEETVSEIAYQVGFSSPTYFNTCFREYYGYPPGEAKLRAAVAEHETDGVQALTPSAHPKDRINLLRKRLNFTKRWVVALAIGIGVTFTWATSYYLSTNAVDEVTNATSLEQDNSIAVLPFMNMSGDTSLEYRGDAMTDFIITRLSFVSNLKVRPFASVQKYKASDKDIPTIAKELGVQYILQGSYRLSGDLTKFTLFMIHGPTNTILSSEEYDGAWNEDIFSMQANVVEDLISQLNVEVNSKELLAIERVPTQNKKAYESWLMAVYQALKYTKSGKENAITLFENAIRLDSNFVEPYVDLAQLYLFGGASWGLFSEREAWNKSKELLQKALEIDDTFPDAKKVYNDGLFIYEWDFENMEKSYQTESKLPINYCLMTGRYEEALAINEQMHKEYPTSPYRIIWKALAFALSNRSEEALELLRDSDKLHLDHIMYLRVASRIYLFLNEYERAYALLNKFIQTYPERPPTVLWKLAACEYQKGNIEAVEQYLAEIEKRYQEGASGSPAWFTGLYYATIGDHERAFEWLQKSYDRHEAEMIWLREEPTLKHLRSNLRYLELYQKVGFPFPPIADFPAPPIAD